MEERKDTLVAGTTDRLTKQVFDGSFSIWQPTPEDMGQWSFAYRALFWRPFLGTNVYAAYDVLAAAAASNTDINASLLLAAAGKESRRALRPILERLQKEEIAITYRVGLGRDTRYMWDVLPTLPALTPQQARTLTKPLQRIHIGFLGRIPNFDMPAWWGREEPSFVPLCGGMVRVGTSR